MQILTLKQLIEVSMILAMKMYKTDTLKASSNYTLNYSIYTSKTWFEIFTLVLKHYVVRGIIGNSANSKVLVEQLGKYSCNNKSKILQALKICFFEKQIVFSIECWLWRKLIVLQIRLIIRITFFLIFQI